MKNSIILLIILVISTGCERKIVESNDTFSVSGIVRQNEIPIQDVEVSIDKKANYTVYTDNSGYFHIADVSKGSHTLFLYKNYPQDGGINKSTNN